MVTSDLQTASARQFTICTRRSRTQFRVRLHLFTCTVREASGAPDLISATYIAFTEPPFRCENEGWGEFDMSIDLFTTPTGGKHTILHDLNFAKTRYEAKHTITFKNPSRELISVLRETGPVPGDENGGPSRKKDADGKKRKRTGQIDMEKLAEGLVKLQEDDLLAVVQMIHDNKSEDTYTKNDIDREFEAIPKKMKQSEILINWPQRENSMSICIRYQIRWSRCYGTLSPIPAKTIRR